MYFNELQFCYFGKQLKNIISRMPHADVSERKRFQCSSKVWTCKNAPLHRLNWIGPYTYSNIALTNLSTMAGGPQGRSEN